MVFEKKLKDYWKVSYDIKSVGHLKNVGDWNKWINIEINK